MTVATILAIVSALCLLAFVYPYTLYPWILRLLRRKPVKRADVDLSVSLLFCAYNEIACLPQKLDNLRELKRRRPGLQILAYDDASSDGSYELMASVPDLLTVVRGPGRTGKAAGMKRLVQQARGDILMFTDADVILSPDAVDRLLPYYGDPEVGGVCCTIFMSGDPASATSQIGSTYWSMDDRLQHLESATGNVMGASGALFSVRRELYPDFPDTVQDDFTVSMSVVFRGRRLVKAGDVIAFTRGVGDRSEEIHRKIRIGARAYHTHAVLRDQRRSLGMQDRFKYASRKMLRWFGAVFLSIGLLCGLTAVALVSPIWASGLSALLLAASYIAVRFGNGHFGRGSMILIATYATLLGVLRGMNGHKVATWAPAKSR